MDIFKKSMLISFIFMSLFIISCSTIKNNKTEVSIVGDEFYVNGKPTFEGKTWRGMKIQGLLPNARLVNGIFDDKTDSTRYKWAYPDTKVWDANRNTKEFVENMSLWKDKGLLAFTINLQGGSPEGYSEQQPWYNSAILPDGSLDTAYMDRLKMILDKADELEMVVILGLFYVGQEKFINDAAAVKNGIKNAIEWVLRNDYRNVLLEINNECDFFKLDGLTPETVHKSIEYAKTITHDGRRLLVSTSYAGKIVPSDKVIAASDYILLHGNGIWRPENITLQVDSVRKSPAYVTQPIVYNEDDHFNFDKKVNNFVKATEAYASWGYFDFRKKEESFEQGFQCPPVDWGINSERKKGFFDILTEWKKGM
ncbi:hypothetical protein [Bacteroides ilei]|uniref:hypothetical protein n=1 Tax=Bacteroides ilei TaxID=1907658 RepID=UPI000A657629|nr:hypothetical protein [Bacteroides ilei]